MIRNYNGNINRTIIWDLIRLCNVNAENERNLFDTFDQEGEVSVYENLDPFTGCPDELSSFVTLKSEAEIEDYLKKDFIKRIDGYLEQKKPDDDYLLGSLIEFIKENGMFPDKNVRQRLEKDAEAKRIAKLPSDSATAPKKITQRDVAKEILELAEEIIEIKRLTRPEDVLTHVCPYNDELAITDDNVTIVIKYNGYFGHKDSRDYRCFAYLKNNIDINHVLFYYKYDGTADIEVKGYSRTDIDISKDTLLSIHKFITKTAKEEGIEFISEVDYDKFQIA